MAVSGIKFPRSFTNMSDNHLERLWTEIKLLLDWHQDFSLFFVLVEDSRAAITLREHVNDLMRSHCKPLRWLRSTDARKAETTLIAELFDETRTQGAPVWLELSAVDAVVNASPESSQTEQPWDRARKTILSILNKRRSELEKRLNSPLFIQLPLSFAPHIVTMAPDLWSIRQQLIELPRMLAQPDIFHEPPIPPLPEDRATLDQQVSSRREALRRAENACQKKPSAKNMRHLAVAQSQLAKMLCRIHLFEEAFELEQKANATFRSLVSKWGQQPQMLRDLSVSLNNLADIARAQGRLEIVQTACEESLTLCRSLRASLGDTPQVLRDLSVGLNKLGDIALIQGRLETAQAAVEESLALRHNLRASLGDSPQVLRDLSISLERLGDVAHAQGRLDAAQAAFEESLTLRRSLRASLGDTPQVLRDLFVALNRLGDIAHAQGRLEAAQAAFEESLTFCRSLRASLSDSPQKLRDLSVSLERLGDVAHAQGRLEAAQALFEESLTLCRSLRASLGDSPQVLWDLSIVLNKLGNIANDQGRLEAAQAAFEESKALEQPH